MIDRGNRGRPCRCLWFHEWHLGEPLVIVCHSLCFAMLTKPEVKCICILLSHTHGNYTGLLVTGFVLLSHWCVPASSWCSHLCLAIKWWMPSHREGPKNISPSSEEQIPLSSYLVPCQTFWWTCKLSLIMITVLQMMFEQPQSPLYDKKWLWYSHGLRN